jgi:hypothetical protein
VAAAGHNGNGLVHNTSVHSVTRQATRPTCAADAPIPASTPVNLPVAHKIATNLAEARGAAMDGVMKMLTPPPRKTVPAVQLTFCARRFQRSPHGVVDPGENCRQAFVDARTRKSRVSPARC